ncbi:unnamed protein product [Allacma fusca]|uniref:Uncharacterized protein n=1 Tax=Allacma fusca TaxID=39272 RepID=A0A8J2NXJ9_9HEXA|nr:unnamed protein product [Allacma fusca]
MQAVTENVGEVRSRLRLEKLKVPQLGKNMNRLLEVWNEFSGQIGVIYRRYIDNLWTKVIVAKKSTCEPAKRQFSVTTTNCETESSRNDSAVRTDRFAPKNSSSKHDTPNGQSRSILQKEDVDLDDSSSTSVDRLGSQNSSKKEPMDQITWSSVTSPGFTNRVAQKKGGNPLREFNSPNLTFSPLVSNSNEGSKSPLRLGQGTSPYKPPSKLQAPNFQSPVNPTRYSVTRRKKVVPFGTTYVHVAPVDVINQTFIKNSNGPGSPNMERQGAYGLGGYPSSPTANLTTRMQKLWSPPMMGDVPGQFDPSRQSGVVPSTPHSPHAMAQCSSGDPGMNRKRNRLPDNMMDKRSSPMRNGPSYQDELAKQNSKRTKYIQSTNDLRYNVNAANRNLPYMALPNLQVNDESMTSESILEQMNQTEKRFLPDDDTIAAIRSPKKNRSIHGAKVNTSASSPSPYRKRRVPTHAITSIDEDEDNEKNRGFCSCSECYEEAAGLDRSGQKLASQSASLNNSVSANKKKKTISFNCESPNNGKEASFITAMTMEKKSNDVTEKYTPVSLQIITKAKYEADKQRRLERLNRMLNESFKRSEYRGSTTPEKLSEVTVPPASVISCGLSNGTTESKLTFGASNSGLPSTISGVPLGDEVDSSKINSTTINSPVTVAATLPEVTNVVTTNSAFSFGAGLTSSSTPVTTSAAGLGQVSSTSPFTFGIGSGSTDVSDKPTASVISLPAIAATTFENKTGGFSFGVSASTALTSAGSTSSSFSFGKDNSTTSGTGIPAFGTNTAVTNTSTGFGQTLSTPSGITSITPSTTTNISSSPTVAIPALFGISSSTSAVPNTTVTPSTTAGGTSTPAVFSFGAQPTASAGATSSDTTKPSSVPLSVTEAKTSGTTTTGGFSFGSTTNSTTASVPAATTSSTFGASFSFGTPATTAAISNQPAVTSTSTSSNSIFGQTNNAGTSTLPSLFGKTDGSASLFGAGSTTPNTVASNIALNTNEIKNNASLPNTTSSTTSGSGAIFSFGQGNNSAPSATAATVSQSSGGGFSFAPGFGSKTTGSESTPASTTSFGQINQKATGTAFPQANALFGNNNPVNSTGLFGQGSVPTTNAGNTSSSFSFGQAAPTTTSGGFGQGTTSPPAFGQSSNTFGQALATPPATAFGQSQGSTVPQFGQSNASTAGTSFGQSNASTTSTSFGQSNGSTTSTSFGQANQPTGVTSFGQASNTNATTTFGSSTSGGSSFGQPNTNAAATSAFGQTSGGTIFGQGQGSTAGASNVFGSNSSGTAGGIFGQSGNTSSTFGQGANTNTTSPFGQSSSGSTTTFGQSATSAFGAAPTASSPFGQPSSGGFGQQSGNNNTGFGFGINNSSSGQTTQSGNAFGSQATQPNAFGSQTGQQSTFGSPVNQPASTFGASSAKPLFGQAASSNNSSNSFSFGQTQQQQSNAFNFGAAAANSGNNNNNTAVSPFGGGFNSQPQSSGMFGSSNNPPSQAAAPSGGAFQFGQAVQQPNQGGFNFSAQAPPAFGQQQQQTPQQQQQGQMFSMGSSSSTARRRDARTGRRYRT